MSATRSQHDTTDFDRETSANRTGDDGSVDDMLALRARELHASAVANVSPATQAQLQQRRRQVLSGKAGTIERGRARPLAWAGAFALLALAIALPLAMRLPQTPPISQVADTAAARATTITTPDKSDAPLATLEEDPEMYVWLASSDAIALASE